MAKKLGLVSLMSLVLAGCGENPSRVNGGDLRSITTLLNGPDGRAAVLTTDSEPSRNGFGEVIGTKGTSVYIEVPGEEKRLLFETNNLIYDIRKGRLNDDEVEDFVVSAYKLSKALNGSFKRGTEVTTYLSQDDSFDYEVKGD